MYNSLNENKMIVESRQQGKSYSPFKLLLVYFVMMLVINVVIQILFTPVSFYLLFSDREILQLIMSNSADYSDVMSKSYELLTNMPEWVNILTLFFSAVMLVVPIIYCKFIEKRTIGSMGFRKRRAVSEYVVGFVAGLIMMAIVAALCVFSNTVTYSGFSKSALTTAVLYMIGYMIQGMAEETLIHGFFMVSSAKNTTLIYSLIMSSMLFSLSHGANSGITLLGLLNIFLFGLFAGVYVLKRGNIWGIGALHASWNFAQGSVLGFNVSGISPGTSIFNFNTVDGMDRLNGGNFGPEGGLFVTLVLFAALGILMIIKPNSHEVVEISSTADTDPM